MLHIRKVKTNSNATAVQVISYHNNTRKIIKHIGSAHEKSEVDKLVLLADEWIKKHSGEQTLFPDENLSSLININQSAVIGVYSTFFYNLINKIYKQIGLNDMHNLLLDLSTIRLIKPTSKLSSIKYINDYFNIKHRRQNFYEFAPKWVLLKDTIELKVVEFMKENYSFNFDLVFYDVTTLYFETFEEDEFRKNGFSKDNKSQQPQIVLALMVNKEGFPIGHQLFSGNTFEGHTIIPTIKSLIEKHKIGQMTVIADAAMISSSNIAELKNNKINYIVGARLGNISKEIFDEIIQKIKKENDFNFRIKTENGFLICSYSNKRYKKDKYEMDKQIEKAKLAIENPSKIKKIKYTKIKENKAELNDDLIQKNKMLLGIKGYYTDLDEKIFSNEKIIERYHELYKIEQAFRISKNDLQTRPIFHFKEEPIKLHILICFISLVISKQIELKTKISIKKFVYECEKIKEVWVKNKITGKISKIYSEISATVLEYLKDLKIPH